MTTTDGRYIADTNAHGLSLPHGSDSTYSNHLCRCRPCTEAHRRSGYRYLSINGRLKACGPRLPKHGQRWWYTTHKCRCDLCRRAEANYRRNLRATKAAAANQTMEKP